MFFIDFVLFTGGGSPILYRRWQARSPVAAAPSLLHFSGSGFAQALLLFSRSDANLKAHNCPISSDVLHMEITLLISVLRIKQDLPLKQHCLP